MRWRRKTGIIDLSQNLLMRFNISSLKLTLFTYVSLFTHHNLTIQSSILSSARSIEIIDMIDADLSLELEREEFASPLEFLRIFHDKYEKRLCGIILPPPPEATVSQYRHDQSSVKKKQTASLWMWHSSHEIEQVQSN